MSAYNNMFLQVLITIIIICAVLHYYLDELLVVFIVYFSSLLSLKIVGLTVVTILIVSSVFYLKYNI